MARHIIDVAKTGLPGWRLAVAAPEGPLLAELRMIGVEVHPLRIEPGVPLRVAVSEFRALVQGLRPDIVHSHLARADILSALAVPGLRVALVSTEHHIAPDRLMFHSSMFRARVMEIVHHVRIRRYSALIAVSESTRRDMLRYWRPTKDITVVRNGVDRPAAPVARQPGLRFLSLARLSSEKNIDMSLRVFAQIHAAYPEARLTVAGIGGEAERLRDLATSLGVSEAVVFPGFVNPIDAMASHTVILQPSRSDNLSYTLLDAVAQGMGVAASSIGGNPEILPRHCLADDDAGFEIVALAQALDPTVRPVLPTSIPTVAEMTEQIVTVYKDAGLGG